MARYVVKWDNTATGQKDLDFYVDHEKWAVNLMETLAKEDTIENLRMELV